MKMGSLDASDFHRASELERQEALRALLRRPLLVADHAEQREDFAKVRRQAEPLRQWLSRHTGWRLEVTFECARLYKVPARWTDATHPARLSKKDEPPFNRRRYVLLCLALAVLVRSERQTTLGELARSIIELWKDEPTFATLIFDLDAADSRRDLVAALRLLMETRALTQVDGDDERFLRQREHEVLYDVHHLILYRLLAARRSPSSITEKDWNTRLAALVAEPIIDEADQRNQLILHHLNRRLLDDPVLYTPGDLPPDMLDYLLKQRPHLIRKLVEATGLEPEDRKDGIALSDRTGDCTDLGLPEEGTDGHATLLTAEFLGDQRLAEPGEIVPISVVERFLAEQAIKNKGFWRKDATAPGAEEALAREVLRRLASLDLVRFVPGGVIVMAAIHRYRHELKPRVTET